MATKKIKCAPQNKKEFESICEKSKCVIKSESTNRFGVTLFEVYYKSKADLEKFESKIKFN